MIVPRRAFLALAGGGAAGSFATGRTRAGSSVTVRADVRSAVGTSIEGSEIEIHAPERRETHRAYVEDDAFEIDLPADTTYQITFFNQTEYGGYDTEPNGVPVLYGLESDVHIREEDVDLGTYEIPEGHFVDIRFEDMDGNPVRDLPISFRAATGSGMGPSHLLTNTEGRVTFRGNQEPGVELADSVGVDIHPIDPDVSPTQVDQLMITEAEELTIPVRDPEQYGGVVESSGSDSTGSDSTAGTDETATDGSDSDTGTDANAQGDATGAATDGESADSHRGFFTNDPESSIALLNDPVRLTWAGIAVSIVGIVAQLLGRQS